MKFEEGERYRHARTLDTDMMILGILRETDEDVVMAVAIVNRRTLQVLKYDEVTVRKVDFDNWTKIEVES